jgi:anion-transporting  ArsA/GET3 family ATPase
MNEILSLIELQLIWQHQTYDTVILDTPPGQHVIDFLDSAKKVEDFLHHRFMEIFQFLEKHLNNFKGSSKTKYFLGQLLSGGIDKILSYMEKITGPSFIQEFVHTIGMVYRQRDVFLKILHLQEKFKDPKICHWFLTSSCEQDKMEELVAMKKDMKRAIHNQYFLLLNKTIASHLEGWTPADNPRLVKLKKSMLWREKKNLQFAKEHFSHRILFSEVLSANPADQVCQMAIQWP